MNQLRARRSYRSHANTKGDTMNKVRIAITIAAIAVATTLLSAGPALAKITWAG
jgi:hypothetical protein